MADEIPKATPAETVEHLTQEMREAAETSPAVLPLANAALIPLHGLHARLLCCGAEMQRELVDFAWQRVDHVVSALTTASSIENEQQSQDLQAVWLDTMLTQHAAMQRRMLDLLTACWQDVLVETAATAEREDTVAGNPEQLR